jgi:hypothetical protein
MYDKHLPLKVSDYDQLEPSITQTAKTTPLSERYARRVYRDPDDDDLRRYELITGREGDSEKIYAYFHFLPLVTVQEAEQDYQLFYWGLLFGKYAYLSGTPLHELRGDKARMALLTKECKEAAPFFYQGLRDKKAARDGVDILGIHLSVRPQGKSSAVITGLTSNLWNEIHQATVNGTHHDLYELFPR